MLAKGKKIRLGGKVLKTESYTQILLVDHRLLLSSSSQNSQKTFQTEILA